MSFIVNGADWQFSGLTAREIQSKIETVLAFVAESFLRDEYVWIGEDFQERPMYGESSLWALFSEDLVANPELCQELAAWLGRNPYYIDAAPWPENIDVTKISVDGKPEEDNVDLAWVHHSVRSGHAIGCLSLLTRGKLQTRILQSAAVVNFLVDEKDRVGFWRDAIVVEGDSAGSLRRLASHAYPNVFFLPGVLDNLDRLAGGYLALRHRVQSVFATLDDYGFWIFTYPPPAISPAEATDRQAECAPSNQVIERRFQSVGIDAAPEKPNVRHSLICRKARERVVGSVTIYCEWHVKLEPHRNRIHIHGPLDASENKVVVAVICDHLPLP